MALNILDNRFFTADHNYTYSLPELISELYKGHIEDLTALPAHEHSAFFTFLVQLSAMLRTKFNTQLSDCQDVRRGLIALTDGNEHSWDLIPEEGQGGFLQPFDPNQPPLAGRKKILSPCGIDTLYYSKGHSTKAMKAFGTSEEQWIYSLVAVQTSSAFSGGGRFGSIRTANTWSSRLFVSLVPIQGNDMRLHHSRWFKMQTDLLEEMRKSTNDPVLMDQYAKSAATWTQNWSGEKDALSIEDIDPHFIEVCRLIRLFQNEEGNIFAQSTGTEGRFVALKASEKEVEDDNDVDALFSAIEGYEYEIPDTAADPWSPLRITEDKSGKAKMEPYSLGDKRLDYREILKIFSAKCQLPEMVSKQKDFENMAIMIDVTATGKSTTCGHYNVIINLPRDIRENLWNPMENEFVKEMLKDIDLVSSIISRAVMLFLSQADDRKFKDRDFWKLNNDFLTSINEQLSFCIDRDFFATLRRIVNSKGDKSEFAKFRKSLKNIANEICGDFFKAHEINHHGSLKGYGVAVDYLYKSLQKFHSEEHIKTDKGRDLQKTVAYLEDKLLSIPHQTFMQLASPQSGGIHNNIILWGSLFPDTIGANPKRWSEIVRTFCQIMGGNGVRHRCHNERVPLGSYLVHGGRFKSHSSNPLVSENRLHRIMNASQDRKATELQSALAIASPSDYKNRRIDFRDIAWCILDEGQGSFKSRLSKDYFKNLREITYTGVSH